MDPRQAYDISYKEDEVRRAILEEDFLFGGQVYPEKIFYKDKPVADQISQTFDNALRCTYVVILPGKEVEEDTVREGKEKLSSILGALQEPVIT
jgi:hypothetical protein